MTRESLSELTTAVAMSRCDDKRHTRRILARAGAAGAGRPRRRRSTTPTTMFLAEVGEVVVKPARGEQGARHHRRRHHRRRARRRPRHRPLALPRRARRGTASEARTCASSSSTTRSWPPRCAARRRSSAPGGTRCATWSRRRAGDAAAATGGESTIPLDDETAAPWRAPAARSTTSCPRASALAVRRTANLHTGGTIHDVTAELHPELAAVAVAASRASASR